MKQYHAKISPKKRLALLAEFERDHTATEAAKNCKLHRQTANHWYRYFRAAIFETYKTPPRIAGEVEIDQKFFGVTKKKRYDLIDGKHILRPQKNVQALVFVRRKTETAPAFAYAHIIKRTDRRTIIPLTRLVVEQDSIIYTDAHRSFIGLADDGYTHHRLNVRRDGHAKRSAAGAAIHVATFALRPG